MTAKTPSDLKALAMLPHESIYIGVDIGKFTAVPGSLDLDLIHENARIMLTCQTKS